MNTPNEQPNSRLEGVPRYDQMIWALRIENSPSNITIRPPSPAYERMIPRCFRPACGRRQVESETDRAADTSAQTIHFRGVLFFWLRLRRRDNTATTAFTLYPPWGHERCNTRHSWFQNCRHHVSSVADLFRTQILSPKTGPLRGRKIVRIWNSARTSHTMSGSGPRNQTQSLVGAFGSWCKYFLHT